MKFLYARIHLGALDPHNEYTINRRGDTCAIVYRRCRTFEFSPPSVPSSSLSSILSSPISKPAVSPVRHSGAEVPSGVAVHSRPTTKVVDATRTTPTAENKTTLV